MLVWLCINLVQAAGIGVDGDEAYYWMLSRNLDWGYFDHPPMVTLLIRIGEAFGHGMLYTRLGTVLITTLSIGMVYLALPEHLQKIKTYILLFSATLVFNVYSFIATPDAPLLFFSAFFFYAYKCYLQKHSIKNVLIMAIAVTGMFYSKYHGLLPVVLVVLSNLKLLTRKHFWLMVLLVTVLFLPHLYWQYLHDWPTVKFHLFERAMKKYKIEFTTNYILGQLLIWGPIISLLFFINFRKLKITDPLIKAHYFNFTGVLVLFLISSFRNTVEPHWTLVAGCSYVILFMHLLHTSSLRFSKTFQTSAFINIGIIVLARILFAVPGSPFTHIKNYRPFFHAKAWTDSIYKKAQGLPVVFDNSYNAPSLYQYYHPNALTTGYNTRTYRKTHYSINNQEKKLAGKPVWFFREEELSDSLPNINTVYRRGNLHPLQYFAAIQNLKITALGLPKKIKPDMAFTVNLRIQNTGSDTIYNPEGLIIEYAYSPLSYVTNIGVGNFSFTDKQIPRGYSKVIGFKIIAPQQTGKNRILFSFKNGPFDGNFASPYYKIQVEN